jgi:hypothetical protein
LAQGEEAGVGVGVHADRCSSHRCSIHNADVMSTTLVAPFCAHVDQPMNAKWDGTDNE